MTDLRKAAAEALPLLKKLQEKLDPESMEWADVRIVHNLKVALSKPDESEWQFKLIGFRTVTMPDGHEEIQFSIADAPRPKEWS